MGSIGDNTSGGRYGYRMSKAAVNMAGRSLAHDLAERGVSVFLLHPGMVATKMTGGQGIPPEEAAAKLREMDEDQAAEVMETMSSEIAPFEIHRHDAIAAERWAGCLEDETISREGEIGFGILATVSDHTEFTKMDLARIG